VNADTNDIDESKDSNDNAIINAKRRRCIGRIIISDRAVDNYAMVVPWLVDVVSFTSIAYALQRLYKYATRREYFDIYFI